MLHVSIIFLFNLKTKKLVFCIFAQCICSANTTSYCFVGVWMYYQAEKKEQQRAGNKFLRYFKQTKTTEGMYKLSYVSFFRGTDCEILKKIYISYKIQLGESSIIGAKSICYLYYCLLKYLFYCQYKIFLLAIRSRVSKHSLCFLLLLHLLFPLFLS